MSRLISFVEEHRLHCADVVVGWGDVRSCEFIGQGLSVLVESVVSLQIVDAVQRTLFVVSIEGLLTEDLDGISHTLTLLLR